LNTAAYLHQLSMGELHDVDVDVSLPSSDVPETQVGSSHDSRNPVIAPEAPAAGDTPHHPDWAGVRCLDATPLPWLLRRSPIISFPTSVQQLYRVTRLCRCEGQFPFERVKRICFMSTSWGTQEREGGNWNGGLGDCM
jgi:hypothetical protein